MKNGLETLNVTAKMVTKAICMIAKAADILIKYKRTQPYAFGLFWELDLCN